ncbi:MAG: hypothetical protein J6S61_00575, partial [Elusimicrobiaceae bacterium]|nr:hypothetical protein [Elusimicrobiaceae bacterium]
IKSIHNIVADMSYIFTNAVPFHKGSASANLAMVHAIYQMFGINAPQVKIGRALDLSAFATTPKKYRENWLSLFEGEFVPQKVTSGTKSTNKKSMRNKQSTETPLNLKTDIVKATIVKRHKVVKLKDSQGNVKAYYKPTTQEEVDRTLLFDKIVKENNLQNKYSLLEFDYPKVLSTKLSDLSDEIIEDIKSKYKFSEDLPVDMITTSVNTKGYYA